MEVCPHCSRQVPEAATVCPSCGGQSRARGSQLPANVKISGFAIASLYLGIVSLLFPLIILGLLGMDLLPLLHFGDNNGGRVWFATVVLFASILLGAVGIVSSRKARERINASDGSLKGVGRLWAGRILGWLVVVLYLPLFAITAPFSLGPHVDGSKNGARQLSAVGCLRTANAAAEAYRAAYGRGYPVNLAVLGPPDHGGASAYGANLIDQPLASGTKSGYVFIYQVSTRDAKHFPSAYTILAEPIEGCGTGHGICYFTDESGVIRMEITRVPDKNSNRLAG